MVKLWSEMSDYGQAENGNNKPNQPIENLIHQEAAACDVNLAEYFDGKLTAQSHL